MATPSNRFRSVASPDPTAVTVILHGGPGAAATGEVMGPTDGPGQAATFGFDRRLTGFEALVIGCQLANGLDRSVVVMDPDGAWSPGWGTLAGSAV